MLFSFHVSSQHSAVTLNPIETAQDAQCPPRSATPGTSPTSQTCRPTRTLRRDWYAWPQHCAGPQAEEYLLATCHARTPSPHDEALLHRPYPRRLPLDCQDPARLTPLQDLMADQAPTRLVQTPPAHQLLEPRRHLLLGPARGPSAPIERPRGPQLLGPLPAQLPPARESRCRRRRGSRRQRAAS